MRCAAGGQSRFCPCSREQATCAIVRTRLTESCHRAPRPQLRQCGAAQLWPHAVRRFANGESVFAAGDRADGLYVVQTGAVIVSQASVTVRAARRSHSGNDAIGYTRSRDRVIVQPAAEATAPLTCKPGMVRSCTSAHARALLHEPPTFAEQRSPDSSVWSVNSRLRVVLGTPYSAGLGCSYSVKSACSRRSRAVAAPHM